MDCKVSFAGVLLCLAPCKQLLVNRGLVALVWVRSNAPDRLGSITRHVGRVGRFVRAVSVGQRSVHAGCLSGAMAG